MTNHQKQWEFLKGKFETGQLSHSYLLSGNEQIGKKEFAKELVKLVNCLSLNKDKPCQKCTSCQMIEKDSFADLITIKPEDGGEIQIAKVRDAQNFLSYKSYYGFYKSIIIEDAEKMNQEAQSCFLKTLEEPKGKTLLLMISSKPEILLDTIKSRCQQIKFFGKQIETKEQIEKEKEVLEGLLKVAGNTLAEKFKYAKSLDFEEQKLTDILTPLEKYLRYLLLKKVGTDEKSYFSNMHSSLENYPISKLKGIINLTEDINNKLFFTNINQKLALEIILLEL